MPHNQGVLPPKWDELSVTNKNYVLLMRGNDYHDNLIELPGYSLGAPEPNTQDPTMVREYNLEGGIVTERERYLRKAFHRSFSLTIGLLAGAIWTPIDKLASHPRTLKRDVFSLYLCPPDSRYGHFRRFPDAVFSEPIDAVDMITVEDEEVPIERTTELGTPSMFIYWDARGTEVDTEANADPVYGISFINEDCDDDPLGTDHQKGIYGGGDGTAAAVLERTTNRFAATTTATHSISVGDVVTDILMIGDVGVLTFSDVFDHATAATGGVAYTTDAGVTWTIAASPTTPMYSVSNGGGRWWITGTDGLVYYSNTLTTWTQFTTGLVANDHLLASDYDHGTGRLYIVGHDETNALAYYIVGNTISDISSDVNATTNILRDVRVLEGNHVATVGASGTMRENSKASDGGTWTTVSVAGTTDDLYAVEGDGARTWVAGGSAIYERSPITDPTCQVFKAITLNPGTTIGGNIVGGATGLQYNGSNYALFSSDVGEIILVAPNTPDA